MASQDTIQNSKDNAIEKILHHIRYSINVAKIAKVVKYDKEKHIANVLPLANLSNGEASPQLIDVPVAKSCYELDEWIEKIKPDYQKIDSFQTEHGKMIGTSLVSKIPKKKTMRVGAIVIVIVLDNDNDNWTGSNSSFTPETGRLHDINDSIIIGVIE